MVVTETIFILLGGPASQHCNTTTEVGIYKRKQERKQELDQESDQEKKKVFSFFLGRFHGRVLSFFFS